MSVDIKPYLQYLEKEKHIPKDEACALIVEAIKSSVEKSVMSGQNVEVTADPATGKLDAHVIYSVTDSVSDPLREINPVAAALLQPGAVVGDEVRKPINVADLGRIAAKTTQQLLNQRFRKIEKDQVFLEYKDKVGDIVTGIVRRTERGNVIVELGTAEAVLTHKERCHGDEFRTGDRIRCLLLEIREDPQRGREFVLSRANDGFVRRLLELEVAEIADKTVTIAKMARDPGYRTKIAVDSSDPKVDPVGACVGARGARVRNIVKELGGEKIDIIRFHKEPLKLLEEAIRPARPRNVRIDERNRSIHFEVDEEDMRIAIGSKGRNARLTSKLMGWGLNIAKATNTPEASRPSWAKRRRVWPSSSACRSNSSRSSCSSA
ncbi:transcription termination/antitermination protein NusA [Verrucomicrobiota bacterium]|nr:transcription termination/antitermination protein NusA [Verrucomicrobiota bacterium]